MALARPMQARPARRAQAARFRRLVAEPLEQRLALSWAGVPPALISVPGNAAGLKLNSQNDAIGSAVITSTEVDYYVFTATATGNYQISTATPTSSVDTVVGLFSATGVRLAYNDNVSAPYTDSELTVNLVAGSRYYLGVTNYSAATRGEYYWIIDGPVPAALDDAYEENDSVETATDLGTLSAARTVGSLVLADSQDFFKFTTLGTGTAGSSVSISFQHSRGDLQLALFNAAGTLVGTSQGTGNTESISLAGLAAGRYYVRVFGAGGTTNPNYTLTIAPPPPSLSVFPDVAYYGGSQDWSVNSINAPEAWAQGYTGQGAIVAVVDTGVDLDHPDLVTQIWVNPGEIAGNGIDDDHNGYVDDISGWDFSDNDNTPDDGRGHGTHVAGIIAAAANGFGATGVAPGATIMPVRVLGSDGSGSSTAVAAGIRYAADNGADIINLSLGGSYSTAILSAIQYAQQRDVLVVAAAGNDAGATPIYPARFSATLSNVVSVGAYSSSNTIAGFSNDVGTSGAVQVDAPGVYIYSTYPNGQFGLLSGTSMAAPQVSGLAALALSANGALGAAQLRTVIVNGANHVIAGSDSRGGVNAAVSVALAASGQLSTTSTSAAANQPTSTQLAAARAILGNALALIDANSDGDAGDDWSSARGRASSGVHRLAAIDQVFRAWA
ncbi:MAG: S8 family serine peptidase [Pirellulales bacterium]